MRHDHVRHSAAISKLILDYAEMKGVGRAECLQGTGICLPTLEDPSGLIEPEQEVRLLGNLVAALPHVPALGFELGTHFHTAVFGVWGFTLTTSSSIQDAIQRAIQYLPLSSAYCSISMRVEGDELYLEADPANIPTSLQQLMLERDMSTAIILVREISLKYSVIKRMTLCGAALPYADRIHELCGLMPEFGAPSNALVLSNQDTLSPLMAHDANLRRMLEGRCRQQIEGRKAQSMVERVRQYLFAAGTGAASIEATAANFCMSERSLRRKLAEEGTSFRELVGDVRHQSAVFMLVNSNIKVIEIAQRLGYTDASSFSRSFKLRESLAPASYRSNRRRSLQPEAFMNK